MNWKLLSVLAVTVLASTACDKTNRSFSLLGDANTFQQVPTVVERKVDILWVIDNSGSMATSQQNLSDNFNSFIKRFKELNYDFRMATIGSDAYRGTFVSSPSYKDILRQFRRGPIELINGSYIYSPDSGHHVLSPSTPDLEQKFITNAKLGTTGTGEERPYDSIKVSLEKDLKSAVNPSQPLNDSFPRPGAFLAIIILSDEDDFSTNNTLPFEAVSFAYPNEVNQDPWDLTGRPLNNLYQDPRVAPISVYKSFLDERVGANNYSVSAITILDQACKQQLNPSNNGGQRMGRRYAQLVDATSGTKSSLCANFGESLELISNKILEVSSSFKLDREPIPSSIRVIVNGALVPQDALNGWTYDAATMTVIFHGTAVPPQGATIEVSFDPVAPKN
jgi:hypothetical protein